MPQSLGKLVWVNCEKAIIKKYQTPGPGHLSSHWF